MIKTIKCDECREVYEYEDNGTVDCMPDGELYQGNWYCYKCLRNEEVN